MHSGKYFMLIGPSSVGKTTTMDLLLKRMSEAAGCISCTSRPPRPDEENGRHYFFLSRSEFEQRIAKEEFLEWAEYAGNYYGTSREALNDLLAKHPVVVKIVEILGARITKKKMPESFTIFLMPESLEQIEERMKERTDAKEGDTEKRLERAKVEMAAAEEFDCVVVNREAKQDETVDQIIEFIRKHR